MPEEYYFSILKKEELREMLAFYIFEIYDHFNFTDFTRESYELELDHLLREDTAFYGSSLYYILRDVKEHQIYGSIKTTYWDKNTPLPIEKLFNVHPETLIVPEITNYWHIGRFVISQKIPKDRISILKKMLFNAFFPVYSLGKGLIVAECDKKLTITLDKLGIRSCALGNSIEYICSETLPIYIRSEWLNGFITSHHDRYFSISNARDAHFFSSKQSLEKRSSLRSF